MKRLRGLVPVLLISVLVYCLLVLSVVWKCLGPYLLKDYPGDICHET